MPDLKVITDDSPQKVAYVDNSPETSIYTLPRVAGTSGQVITIDANGDCNFQSVGSVGTLGSIEFRALPYYDNVNAAASDWSPSGKTITPEVYFNLSQVSYNGVKTNNTWRYEDPTNLTFTGGNRDTGVTLPALGFATHTDGVTNPNVTGNFIYTDAVGTEHTFSFRVDWLLIQEGAAGSDGAAGNAARGVILTASDQSIEYNKDGTTPNPATVTVFAEAVNASQSQDVYFEFFIDDVSQGSPTAAGNDSPFAAQITIASPTTIGSPKKVECQIREGSASNAILARDQIVIFPLKQGSDAITIILSNEAHTLPTTNAGTVTYTDSGTDIEVYEGTNQLGYDGTSPYPNSTYRVSASGTNITPSTPTTVTDTSPLDLYSPQTGYVRRYGNHSSMTADNASIEYTITVKNDEGVERTFIKKQSLAKSVQGAEGSAGSDGRTVTLTADKQLFDYDTNGANPTPSSATITATARNTTGTVYYEFFENDSTVQGPATGNTYTYTPQADIANMPEKIECEIREGAVDGTIVARDQFTTFGLQPGSSAITIAMSNEAHTIKTGPLGDSPSSNYPNSGTNFRVFEGNNQLRYDESGSPAVSTYRITADTSPTSDITIGGASTLADEKTRVFAAHSDMVNNDEEIVFSITVKRADGTESTFTRTQSLSKSISGEPAKTVRLTAADYVIEYDQSGLNPDPSSTILLTGTAQGFVDPYFKFTGDGITDETSYTNGTSGTDADTFSFSVPSTYTSTPKTLRVGVAEASAATTEIAFDSITIASVKEGSGNVMAFLTNDSHVFPADSSGAVTDFNGSGTRIEVFEGATELDFDGSGTTAGHFTVTASGTNITPGAITAYDSPPENSPAGYKASVADASTGVANGINTSTIVYTISGKRGNGEAFSITKNQTFSKSTDGAAGAAGTDAAAVKLIADSYVIPFATKGDESPETAIAFTTEIQSITNPYYEFYVNKHDGNGDVKKRDSLTTSTFTLADADEPAVNKTVTVKVKVYEGDSPGVEDPVAIDSVSIYAVQGGSDAVTGFLTNASHVVVANSSGTVSSGGFDDAGGTYKVFVGSTEVTSSCTFSVSSETGVDVSIDSSGVYSIASMGANQGTATFQAIIPAGTAGSTGATLTADYSISKSIEGGAGAAGDNGLKTASGLLYYTVASSSNPGAPSGTISYNFSNRTFTGLPSNWQTTPVEVVISDTTTKYWSSRYDVTETTAGGGTGTPSFATPTGSINFGSTIQSDNYSEALQRGWRIQRDTGDAEFNNIKARGALRGGKVGPRDHIAYNSPCDDSPLPFSETGGSAAGKSVTSGFYIGPDDSPFDSPYTGSGGGSYDLIIGDATHQLRFDGSKGRLDLKGVANLGVEGTFEAKGNSSLPDVVIYDFANETTAAANETNVSVRMYAGQLDSPTGDIHHGHNSRVAHIVTRTGDNGFGGGAPYNTDGRYEIKDANAGEMTGGAFITFDEIVLRADDSNTLRFVHFEADGDARFYNKVGIGRSPTGSYKLDVNGDVQVDGNINFTGNLTQNGSTYGGSGGTLTGSGTANKISKWSGSSALTDSLITDNGSTVAVGGILTVSGNTTLGDASGDSVTINAATIDLANVAAGTDNTVLVYNGSTILTDEIDSRVWGSTLVDGSGSSNTITKWSDSNTVTNSTISDDGTSVTIDRGTVSGDALPLIVKAAATGSVVVEHRNESSDASDTNVTHRYSAGPVGGGTDDAEVNLITTHDHNTANGTFEIKGIRNVDAGIVFSFDAVKFRNDATTTTFLDIDSSGNVRFHYGIEDKDGDLGTSGQVLSSTGSQVNWVDAASVGGGGTLTGSGTANKISKWSGSSALTDSLVSDDGTTVSIAANDFTVDTDTLFVDASADRVGINDSTPSYSLDVNGTGRFTSTVRFDGQTQNYNGAYDIYRSGAGYLRHRIADQTLSIGVTNTSDTVYYPIVIDTPNDVLKFNNEEGEMARFDTSGRLGIGTTSPTVPLQVDSTAGAGILIRNDTPSSTSPILEVRGQRSDTNNSSVCAGGVALTRFATSNQIVDSNDIGSIYFGAGHGASSAPEADILLTASICAEADETFSDANNMATDLVFRTGTTGRAYAYNLSYGDSEVMRIVHEARVGIGTTTPAYKLDINDDASTGAGLRVTGGGSGAAIARFERDVGASGMFVDISCSSGDPQIRFTESSGVDWSIGVEGDVFEIVDGSDLTGSSKFEINSTGDATTAGDITVQGGVGTFGVSDSTQGQINVYGGATGGEGGEIRLYNNADDDSTYDYWRVDSDGAGQFRIGRTGLTDLTVDQSGNFGIGTTSAGDKLEVGGDITLDTDNANIKLKSGVTGTTGALYYTFNTDSSIYGRLDLPYDTRASVGLRMKSAGGYPITIDSGNGIQFAEDGTTKGGFSNVGDFYVDTDTLFADASADRVGINTNSPSYSLDVIGNCEIDNQTNLGSTQYDEQEILRVAGRASNVSTVIFSQFRDAAGSDWTTAGSRIQEKIDSTYMAYMQFNGSGNAAGISWGTGSGTAGPESATQRMVLNSSGNLTVTGDVTAFVSDERLKTRVDTIDNAVEKVRSLNGFIYKFNDTAKDLGFDTEKRQVGLSAQEVEKVLPEVIKPAPVDNKYKTLDYAKVVPLLVEAIKEQQEQIEDLQKKLEEMSK